MAIVWIKKSFDNTKKLSWIIHNYSPIINSEVRVYIKGENEPLPNDSSPYITIPNRTYNSGIKTGVGDDMYYALIAGGRMAALESETMTNKNFDIPTEHINTVVNGEYSILIKKGALVAFQGDPEKNDVGSLVKYRVGDISNEGIFTLKDAQMISLTFVEDTNVTFFGENFNLNIFITASQNATMLDSDTLDTINSMQSALNGMLNNVATIDMLTAITRQTYAGNYVAMNKIDIGIGNIEICSAYITFTDINRLMEVGDIVNIYSRIETSELSASIELSIRRADVGYVVDKFITTDPTLSKMIKDVVVTTKTLVDCAQHIRVSLTLKDEYVLSGSVSSSVSIHNLVAESFSLISFETPDVVTNVFGCEVDNIYQNIDISNESTDKLVSDILSPTKNNTLIERNIKNLVRSSDGFSESVYTLTFDNEPVESVVIKYNGEVASTIEINLNMFKYPFDIDTAFLINYMEFEVDTITGDSSTINIGNMLYDTSYKITGGSHVTLTGKINKSNILHEDTLKRFIDGMVGLTNVNGSFSVATIFRMEVGHE